MRFLIIQYLNKSSGFRVFESTKWNEHCLTFNSISPKRSNIFFTKMSVNDDKGWIVKTALSEMRYIYRTSITNYGAEGNYTVINCSRLQINPRIIYSLCSSVAPYFGRYMTAKAIRWSASKLPSNCTHQRSPSKPDRVDFSMHTRTIFKVNKFICTAIEHKSNVVLTCAFTEQHADWQCACVQVRVQHIPFRSPSLIRIAINHTTLETSTYTVNWHPFRLSLLFTRVRMLAPQRRLVEFVSAWLICE